MSGEKVFLSYASVDRPRVEVLVKALERQGLDVWWDRDIPRGQSFNRVIEGALKQAKCVIAIWSRASIASEWVFNEASDARKREILVPVLIDDVEPPLEFRHLQAARLIDWQGDSADAEWAGLLEAVRALVQQESRAGANRVGVPPVHDRRWWQTPAGMALGAGALLAGAAVLLIAFKQVGLLGGAAPSSQTGTPPAAPSSASAQAPAATQAAPAAAIPQATVEPKAARTAESINLLDPEEGGKLVIASEDNWRSVMQRKLQTTVIGTHGFAVFAFRDEKPAVIDTIGVFVESTNGSNFKEIAVYAADQSETGPFRKITLLTVPDYRNMRTPMHEFKVEPFTARYVKIELMSWQHGGAAPNGYVGNLELRGKLR